MIRIVSLAAVLGAVVVSTAGAAPSVAGLAGPALTDALREGGYVIYFRHAATDFSEEDTDTRNLQNCRTQRNLTSQGRADARAIGRAFRRLRIPVGAVLASRYCRTRQTALLAFGRVRTTMDLTSLPSASTERERDRRVAALRRLLATPPRRGVNHVLVAHLFNIQAAANVSLDEGEAAVFAPRGGTRFRLVARIRPEKWAAYPRRLAASAALRIREYRVPAGARPHDVAPARDGGVWYTAQGSGHLGWLDPKSGRTRQVALGAGSAPHGVIVGADGAPWVTDGGLNAIVRVDGRSLRVRRFPLPADRAGANLNTATFDRSGRLWFTGQTGVYGRLDPRTGRMRVFDAPRGAGPYGISTTAAGEVWYASLAGSHVAHIDTRSGRARIVEPPTDGQGARRIWPDSRGRLWVSEWNAGKLAVYNPRTRRWREWRLPGANPQPYAVYVDEADLVWLTDFGSNSLVRFDPARRRFQTFRLPQQGANVRQLLGRDGEVWGAESGTDRLVVATSRSARATSSGP